MPRNIIDAPFVGGMVTDLDGPGYALRDDQTTFAQDLIATRGVARQRRGTETAGVLGLVNSSVSYVSGLWKSDYVLADKQDVILVTHTGTYPFTANAAATGTNTPFTFGQSSFDGSDVFGDPVDSSIRVSWLKTTGTGTANIPNNLPSDVPTPRAMYNDELLVVFDDGEQPMLRYSGAGMSFVYNTTGTPYLGANSSVVYGTYNSNVEKGGYIHISSGTVGPTYDALIDEFNGSSEISLANVLTSTGTTEIGTTTSPGGYEAQIASLGRTFPCVPVYDAGVVKTTGTVIGYGTKWSGGDYTLQDSDAIVIHSNDVLGTSYIDDIGGVTSGTKIVAALPQTGTSVPYTINRCAPFTEVEVHKNSLFGAGVKQKPGSVWVAPPGWGLTEPPGFALPFDISAVPATTNFLDFQMDEIPVPVYADGDPIVALVSFGDALGVIKEDSLHAIYGAYPQFSQQKLADGVGCIDKRSAWSLPSGPFWAGRDGIFTFQGGLPVDITEGTINRQWRHLTRDFDTDSSHYCTIGEVYEHVIVNINVGSQNKTFVFDLNRKVWISEFSNFNSKFYFTSTDGEYGEDMYFLMATDSDNIGTASGTVYRAAGCFYDTDSSSMDAIQPDSGFAPQMKAYTTLNLGEDFTRDQRLLNIGIDTNITDLSGTNTTLGIDHVGGGDFDHPASLTTTVGTITSDAVDRLDYTHFRGVNYPGRLHQLRFRTGTTNVSTDTVEVARITTDWRNNRSRA